MKSIPPRVRKIQGNLDEIIKRLQIPKPPYDYKTLSRAAIAFLGLNEQELTLLLMIDLSDAYASVEPKAETDEQKTKVLERIIQTIAKSETESLPSGGGQIRILNSTPIDVQICQIIQNAIHKNLYGPNEKWFSFEVIPTPESDEIVIKFEGAKESLHDNIKYMLKDYPKHYFRFSGDLKASDIIYEDIDSSWIKHLIVTGTFYCDKNTKIFPAEVDTLDCRGLGKDYITCDTKLPKARVINCERSITDFDVFMQPDEEDSTKLVRTLPAEVKTLIVETSLITFEDNKHLDQKQQQERQKHFENIMKFKNVYGTTINVQDPKGDTLENNLHEHIFGEEKPVESTTKKIGAEPKIKGTDLTVKDLLMYVRSDKDKYGKDKFPDDKVLTKRIKEALTYVVLKKKKVMDEQGDVVDSINFSQFDTTFIEILDKVIELRQPKKEDDDTDSEVDLSFLNAGKTATKKVIDLSHSSH